MAARFIRFLLLGGISWLLAWGLTILLLSLPSLSAPAAYGLAQTCIFLLNFFAARHLVFHALDETIGHQASRFLYAALTFRGINWLAFTLLDRITGLPAGWLVLLSYCIVFPWKFIVYDKKVFHEPANGTGPNPF